ncbi:MAG: hypothetical protein J6B65_00215 [Paludibacteraceae bacterium]|nr:hypothetical protein [Paludibacteraceae bacterium]
MDKAIGGYFELELRKGEHYHKDALRLNTARNCFEYVLLVRKYTKVYIPYFTCEVMLEPLQRHQIEYEFYHINEQLEPVVDIVLQEREAFLYTNYCGLKQSCVERLAKVYGKQLIVDNAQAFFAPRLDGIDTFYSPRKFFGVADGGYLYIDKLLDVELQQDYSYDRMSHLLKRIDLSAEEGYADFRRNDDSLINQPIKRMSKLTEAILCSIDYEEAKVRRLSVYKELHKVLHYKNRYQFELNLDDVPMVYPYFIEDGEQKKKELIKSRIYVATYWPNVFNWIKEDCVEYNLAKNIINIPINNEKIINIWKK